MAAIVKHWREASTVMLVTSARCQIQTDILNPQKTFKERLSHNQSEHLPMETNLHVLMMKRNAKSKFMPDLFVFPGGVASDTDFSAGWTHLFHSMGKEWKKSLYDFFTCDSTHSSMFNRVRDEAFSEIPSEVAFRICAIRETFEESGILLTRKLDEVVGQKPWSIASMASSCSDQDVLSWWRRRVNDDASQFLHMCLELDMVPDIWSLYEWSNWLSPVSSSRRFDTAFFLCCIHDKPLASMEDDSEIVLSKWSTPDDFTSQYHGAKIGLPPPQFYELQRLKKFQTLSQLLQFAWNRQQHQQHHVMRWLPVPITTKDAVIISLPGDSLYPGIIDPECEDGQAMSHDLSMLELADKHPHTNHFVLEADTRMEGNTPMMGVLDCNIEQLDGHVSPIPTVVHHGDGVNVDDATPHAKL